MGVRAKFYVTKIANTNTRWNSGGANPPPEERTYRIELSPIVDGSQENKEFYKWTPGGSIILETVNEAVAQAFKDFGAFYVDFTPAS